MRGCGPQGSERLWNFLKAVQPVNGGAEITAQQLLPESSLFPVYLTKPHQSNSFAID